MDRILGWKTGEKAKPADPITMYDLYERQPSEKWYKRRDLDKAVDFNQLADAMPGYSYRLCSRHWSGKLKTLWYEYLEGPEAVQVTTVISFAEIQAALEPMIRFGEVLGVLQYNIRAAFSWAFPEQQQSGGWSWQSPPTTSKDKTVGSVMRLLLKLGEEAVEGANNMSRAEYDRLMA